MKFALGWRGICNSKISFWCDIPKNLTFLDLWGNIIVSLRYIYIDNVESGKNKNSKLIVDKQITAISAIPKYKLNKGFNIIIKCKHDEPVF